MRLLVDRLLLMPIRGGTLFVCHPECKAFGEREEAFLCQQIDADCNDCKHFKRVEVIKRMLSCMEDGEPSMRLVNMGFIAGHCIKFDKPTFAEPNKWTGYECFEHRRTNQNETRRD
jgi:hypothetical protein